MAPKARARRSSRPDAITRFTSFDKLPDWLSVEEAGLRLGLGRASAYAAVRSGELVARRFGRLWRIPREAVRSAARATPHPVGPN
jgi:excisionase family DNA binding protein